MEGQVDGEAERVKEAISKLAKLTFQSKFRRFVVIKERVIQQWMVLPRCQPTGGFQRSS